MSISLARSERQELCELMSTLGPDAPTLCAGWTAFHLAAHLHLRESDPVAAAGIAVPALKPTAERRMAKLMAETDFDQLVAMVAQGPGRLNPMRVPAVDERANALEFFVHHEDLRRGGSFDVRPRVLGAETDDLLWDAAIKLATRRLRGVRVGVLLQRVRDGRPTDELAVVATGRAPVTVSGEPSELVLWLFGRERAAEVRFSGPVSGLAKLRARSLAG